MSIRVFALAAMTLYGHMAVAQSPGGPLSADQVRAALFGRTMIGEYPDGQAWAEQFHPDGTSSYSQDGQVFAGKMTLQGRNICFEYGPETGFTGGCFEVWKRSSNCFDFYNTAQDGGATATDNQKYFGQGWSARAWYPDERNTCVTEQIS